MHLCRGRGQHDLDGSVGNLSRFPGFDQPRAASTEPIGHNAIARTQLFDRPLGKNGLHAGRIRMETMDVRTGTVGVHIATQVRTTNDLTRRRHAVPSTLSRFVRHHHKPTRRTKDITMRKHQALLCAVLGALIPVASCSDTDQQVEPIESVSTTDQSLTVDQLMLTVAVPAGVSSSSIAILGGTSVTLGSGATVLDSHGQPASIANVGYGELRIGQTALIGTSWMAATTLLRPTATVLGLNNLTRPGLLKV